MNLKLLTFFDIDSDEAKQDDFDVDAELESPANPKQVTSGIFGKHTVICGDSTLPETYTALLGDTKVNLVCTDRRILSIWKARQAKSRMMTLTMKKDMRF